MVATFSRLLTGAGAALLACTATNAMAQSSEGSGFRVGVTGGTLGIGPEAGFRFSETIGVRANATFLSINASADSDELEFFDTLQMAMCDGERMA